jgi:hypothetical protein
MIRVRFASEHQHFVASMHGICDALLHLLKIEVFKCLKVDFLVPASQLERC